MYFRIHKNYKHANEQAKLLEVCGNAGFGFRHGSSIHSLIKVNDLK